MAKKFHLPEYRAQREYMEKRGSCWYNFFRGKCSKGGKYMFTLLDHPLITHKLAIMRDEKTGTVYQCHPIPEFILDLQKAGGLLAKLEDI